MPGPHDSIHPLTEEEAGGHGDHWAALGELIEVLPRAIEYAMSEEAKACRGISGNAEVAFLEFDDGTYAFSLHYGEARSGSLAGGSGVVAVLQSGEGTHGYRLRSSYPFLDDGFTFDGRLVRVEPFPNKVEARLLVEAEDGVTFRFFDTLYAANGDQYESGSTYRFSVAGLLLMVLFNAPGDAGHRDIAGTPFGTSMGPTSKYPADVVGLKGHITGSTAIDVLDVPCRRLEVDVWIGGILRRLPFYLRASAVPEGRVELEGLEITAVAWMQGFAVEQT